MVPELACAVLMVEGVEEGGAVIMKASESCGLGQRWEGILPGGEDEGKGCFLNILFIAVAIIC